MLGDILHKKIILKTIFITYIFFLKVLLSVKCHQVCLIIVIDKIFHQLPKPTLIQFNNVLVK